MPLYFDKTSVLTLYIALKREPSCPVGGNVNWYISLSGNSIDAPQKQKSRTTTHDPTVPFLSFFFF